VTEPVQPARPAPDRSMLWVATGLGVFGLANFVFLALVGRDLGPAGSAPVAVAWTILNAVGIGLFQPLEQETSRRLSAGRARREAGSHLGGMVRYAVLAGAVVVVVGLVGAPWIADRLFAGARDVVVVVVLGLLGQGVAYFARGVLAGTDRFSRYGMQLAVDGLVRILAAGALFATGSGTRLGYGLVLVVAPLVATLLTVAVSTLVGVWRDRTGEHATTGMAGLVTSSTSSQLLANLGPVAMAWLATAGEQDLSGRFVAAVTVARIPLFLFAAIQAVFLPALAALVASGRADEFSATVRRASLATTGLAVAGVGGVAVLGHWVMRLIYGPEFTIGTVPLVLVALSGGLFMLAQVSAQALLAHHQERTTAVGWSVGVVAAVVTLAGPWSLPVTVALALCVGSAVSLVVLAVALVVRVRAWRADPTPTRSPTEVDG
jgi:O-antigen/teichoic acid export membrane protein